MAPAPRPRTEPVALSAVVELADGLPAADGRGHRAAVPPEVVVTGVSLDSRALVPGDLYAALPGRHAHGAQFAAQAVSSGAAAILTDEDGCAAIEAAVGSRVPIIVVDDPRAVLGPVSAQVYGRPAERLAMVGVTGTNGKTTVAAMVAAGLRAAGRCVGVIGTVGTLIGDRQLPGVRTTPEAPDLHALLALMLEAGVDSVVMEVSSIAVNEHRVDGLVLDAVGFTNLTQDHLDYHGSMQAYFDAKARLFTPAHARAGIVGIDDDWGRALAAQSAIPVGTWSLTDPTADWHAVRDGNGLGVISPGGARTDLALRLPGAFNVANALCAMGLLGEAGVDPAVASAGIATAVVPGRMEVIGDPDGGTGGIVGIVDYAHTPDAVERVLRAARGTYSGRVIAVLGAGGDRDRSKRALMGERAAALADHLVVTDDNPRTEVPGAIRAAVLEGVASVAPARRASVVEVADRREAITVAVREAGPGDVVIVMGKGHEQGQEVDGVVEPFDDAVVLREALAARADEGSR